MRPTTLARASAPALLALSALWLGAGCTLTADHGGTGQLVVNMPGSLPDLARAPAPPPGSAPPAPRAGPYSGTGRLVGSAAAQSGCLPTIAVPAVMVGDGTITFNGTSGPIGPDGGVQIQAGRRWLTGFFIGSAFEGRVWSPPPGCTYAVSLAPGG